MRVGYRVAWLAALGPGACVAGSVLPGKLMAATASNASVELRAAIERQADQAPALVVTLKNIGKNEILIDHDLICMLHVNLFDRQDAPIDKDIDVSDPEPSRPLSPGSFKILPPGRSVSRTIRFPGRERFITVTKKMDAGGRLSDIFSYQTAMKTPPLPRIAKMVVIYGDTDDVMRSLYRVLGEDRAKAVYRETLTVILTPPGD
jgi:hypothetical protein